MWGIGLFESLFPIFFLLFFGFAIYMIVSTLAARARENRRNDASPRLTVPASVVAKRAQVGSSVHHNAATHTSSTHYNTRLNIAAKLNTPAVSSWTPSSHMAEQSRRRKLNTRDGAVVH